MVVIGSYSSDTNIFLAPMSGCTDLPFRLIARQHGAKLCFFEMVDCNSLINHSRNNHNFLQCDPADRPIAAQLVGADPDDMVQGAKQLLGLVDVSFIDINAACPVKKITKKKAGAYLLREPQALYKIIKKMAAAIPVPVTVKLRVGYEGYDRKEITGIAKQCAKSGAAALFIHGRTRAQLYCGEINYKAIRAVKHSVKIPVFGSGNIFSPELAAKMLAATDCDGITVARGALGHPWIFQEIEHYLATGKTLPPVETEQKKAVLKQHLSYIDKYKAIRPSSKVGLMRKAAIWYLKSFPHAAQLRDKMTHSATYEEILYNIEHHA
ncbi:MAG: tRNA dihydrouridine synthase DusB [Candidatus Margulisbacteria bacterium]|nr:tRNA dihydrouridine synthase DusB [Candidatus Margulisiibacteriota bacterium]